MAEVDSKALREEVGVDKCANMTDADVNRFLVARNHNLVKSKKMLEEYLKFYGSPIKGSPVEDDTPANILNIPDFEAQVMKDYFKYSYLGHDKEGCPLYWERTGWCSANFHIAKKHITEDRLVRHHILKQEFMTRNRMKHASDTYKKDISKMVLICDLDGLNLTPDVMAISYFIRAVTIDQNNHPERLKRFFIINAPWFFTGQLVKIAAFVFAYCFILFLFLRYMGTCQTIY